MSKLRDALRDGAGTLHAAGLDGAGRDARRLMAAALNVAPDRITLMQDDSLPPATAEKFAAMITRRATREPVAQIVGGRMFFNRWFTVTPEVLDPRPETETLVEAALAVPFTRLLDLGTGSGALLVTLLAERAEATGLGVDLSPPALAVASKNAQAMGVQARATFAVSDWFASVTGRFDLIVANPPYIAASEMAALQPEVRLFEPHMALTDGADGLGAYRAIAARVGAHLTPGGWLMVEIGPTQAAAVTALFAEAGLGEIRSMPDFDSRDRVIIARTPV